MVERLLTITQEQDEKVELMDREIRKKQLKNKIRNVITHLMCLKELSEKTARGKRSQVVMVIFREKGKVEDPSWRTLK